MIRVVKANIDLGWEEWISLPSINLPAIKAKVDTGALTSALHAKHIEVFKVNKRRYVRSTSDFLFSTLNRHKKRHQL